MNVLDAMLFQETDAIDVLLMPCRTRAKTIPDGFHDDTGFGHRCCSEGIMPKREWNVLAQARNRRAY